MDSINSPEGRWSISPCTCTEGTIHFAYGNATLHILAEDLRELGMAMQRMAAGIQPGHSWPRMAGARSR